jgi:hypothetical protein
MDRRLALKQLALITGGAILIPSCDFSPESVLDAYRNLHITESDRNALRAILNIVFPGVHLKKAEELDLQDFVLVMANDCLNEEEQRVFVKGLREVESYSRKAFGKSFGEMDAKEGAEAFRQAIKEDGKPMAPEEVREFLATAKRFGLQGYLTSSYYMTEIMPYNMIPGGYRGTVNIAEIERINTNG